jgi:hypothetical protein
MIIQHTVAVTFLDSVASLGAVVAILCEFRPVALFRYWVVGPLGSCFSIILNFNNFVLDLGFYVLCWVKSESLGIQVNEN